MSQMVPRVVFHPAGLDGELRAVVEEVEAGRWMAMRDLLAASYTSPGLRTARSQVLGAVAAGSTVVEEWRREEPTSVDAAIMVARVAVERALRASRQRPDRAGVLAGRARETCWSAVRTAPADPVPWVCLLALAQLDLAGTVQEHRASAPWGESFLPVGPWGLLHEAMLRDPVCREGHVRMLQFWLSRPVNQMSSTWNFVFYVEDQAPAGSPLLVLPLLAHAEHYRALHAVGRLETADSRQWQLSESIARRTERAWAYWFRQQQAEPVTAVDLNLLAHALWAGRRRDEASAVFDVIGPHASRIPWAYVAGAEGPEQEFLVARTQCLPGR
jgi:hypothetical protein